MDEVKTWQNRPLENMYPVMFPDALMVKMRHEGRVENRAVYVAIGINEDGQKDVLGLWSSANEGARFWLDHWRRQTQTLSGDKLTEMASLVVSDDRPA